MLAAGLWMALVAVAFCGLAATDRPSARRSRPALRRFIEIFWLFVVVGGWVAFAYFALVTPGGLDKAWLSVQAEGIAVRVLMWLLLLPWMIALRLSQLSWPEWLEAASIIGLAIVTLLLSWRTRRA